MAERLPYRDVESLTPYAHLMRAWPGFGGNSTTDGHVVRMTPRDFPVFQRMLHGADYPQALEVAEALFEERVKDSACAADGILPGSAGYAALRRKMIPPYDPDKFPNKWWKLRPDAPARTLTAHMGKDTYSHIHYDGRQRRTVSVREAARLQSFPDGFHFSGEMNAAFRQIGNAVPPLLAFALARKLILILRRAARRPVDHSRTA